MSGAFAAVFLIASVDAGENGKLERSAPLPSWKSGGFARGSILL
ncbi:MAG: hypothetical protein RL518_1420 [Pseudomonadota bacterium]|jgi:hypothetical protein